MPLPAPDLDDRRFQDLVDEAKRMIRRRCPEWTDHNVSDPGVTLIEAFAGMVDQLIYRLNQVPERTYVSFLDLLGLELFPPSAARVPVTFWLTAPQLEDVVIEAGTQVATRRRRGEEPVAFRTVERLAVLRCSLRHVMTQDADAAAVDRTGDLLGERPVKAFGEEPRPGNALLVGLDRAVPSCIVALRVDCRIEGYGVDPRDPPLVWEALCDGTWVRCDVDDETGGFNQPGSVAVHVPPNHAAAVVEGRSGGWLRCRLVPAREDQPAYTASPLLRAVEAATVGGTTTAVHGEDVRDEVIGSSEGVGGQRFAVRHAPIVAAEQPVAVEVGGPGGWEAWEAVDTFARSGPDDRHWRLSARDGVVEFGPAVREPDGPVRQFGAVPPVGAHVRVRRYRTGGGVRGNIAAGEIATLTSAIPFVGRVENRRAATGGVDGESVEEAKVRGPLLLGTRNRAVTIADHEQLALEATPELARVRCLAVGEDGRPVADDAPVAGVRVLLVPAVGPDAEGRIPFEQLVPSPTLLERVREHLDERRMVGARIQLAPPRYLGVTVVLQVRARPRADVDEVQARVLEALHGWFDPLRGGPEGDGWPFGRPVVLGEVHSVVGRLEGVDLVEDARVFPADPITGQRGAAATRIDVDADSLVVSYGHQVRVVR